MRDWSKINQNSIKSDRVLLKEFALDFEKTFKEKLNIGCNLCIKDAYKRLNSINSKQMKTKKNECEYKFKAMYNGSLFWKGKPVRSGEMTDKLAKDLIKNHPHGKGLFDSIPKKTAKKKEVQSDVKEKESTEVKNEEVTRTNKHYVKETK